MKKWWLFLLIVASSSTTPLCAQWRAGLFAGIANYYGDLNDTPFNQPLPVVGVQAAYELSPYWRLRGSFNMGRIQGSDKYSSSGRPYRNLSFESKISEWSVDLSYALFDVETFHWTPYVFGGVSVFHFNPYTFDTYGKKVYLHPLHTEGQGLPEYSQRRNYALTAPALPFGVGVRFQLSPSVELGLETGVRKTFTDYLDDVSTTYVDPNVLLNRVGQQSVDLSYRGDEGRGSATYPKFGAGRGNPKKKDGFYFTGLHISVRLFEGEYHGSRKTLDCPPLR
ncbi:MAG: DUF6089 family protein [Flavisolibacter sp.]